MRIRSQKQLYFKPESASYAKKDELSQTSEILESLESYDEILGLVQRDLSPSGRRKRCGREGMTAEQVFRSLLLLRRFDYSYRGLADEIEDSNSVRDFLKIGPYDKGFKYKTLQSNIKLLSEGTLDFADEVIKRYAESLGVENGEEIRTDGFTTQTNIHYPTDWSLMNDSIRVLSRVLTCALEDLGVPIEFVNHYRASKKKLFNINNSSSEKKKHKWNLELIRLCRKTINYSKNALPALESFDGCKSIADLVKLQGFIGELKQFIPLAERILDQAYRRIVCGEHVPADEKLFSIFEPDTDIIVKGRREVVFGHKITITTGKSSLILDVDIHEGNPADSTLVKGVIEHHKDFYGAVPQKAVFDGCYSSTDNRKWVLSEGVQDVCFSKETDEESACSKAVRKALRFFRAGIEATVSMLKRMFGLTRVRDKGLASFRKAVKSATLSYNLFILSRLALKA